MLTERQTRSRTGKNVNNKRLFSDYLQEKRQKPGLFNYSALILEQTKTRKETKYNLESERARDMKLTSGIYTFDGVGSCYK